MQNQSLNLPKRVQLDRDGLSVDGDGISLVGLVIIISAAIYAAFASSRWWLPLVILVLIPAIMLYSRSRGRLERGARTARLRAVDNANRPYEALVDFIAQDLNRAGFDTKKDLSANRRVIKTPERRFLLEVTDLTDA